MNKIKIKDIASTILREGKIIERKLYPERYTIAEYGDQLFKITNPNGKGVKVEQIERNNI